MTQKINCRFQEYCLPEKPKWFHHWRLALAETLGTAYGRENKSFPLEVENPELFLIPKAKFSVDKSLIDTCQQDKAVFEFKIVKWRFRWAKQDETTTRREPVIDLDVREVKLTPLQKWFSTWPEEAHVGLAGISIMSAGAIAGFSFYSIYNYPEPRGFWVWFGQHVQAIVGWGLVFSLLILDYWAISKSSKSPFIQKVVGLTFGILIILVPLLWINWLSAPPQPISGYPDEYIQYLDYLRTRLATFILMIAANVLWLAPLIKWLGWDLVVALAQVTPKERKKSPE